MARPELVSGRPRLPAVVSDTVAAALGRDHRADPVLPDTGGPAGNARLTAWTGMVLLVLLAAEGVTLLDIHGLITWHLVLGVLLVPPALLKTSTTGWRIMRYYTGNASYRAAGPPPLVLRLVGPLVVLTTLLLLGTGVALVLEGQTGSRRTLVALAGQGVDLVGVHKAVFVAWFVVMTVHVLGRTLPAWQLLTSSRRRVPGLAWRGLALVVTGALAAGCVGWVLLNPGGWRDDPEFQRDDGLGPSSHASVSTVSTMSTVSMAARDVRV
ncbi:MAG: hypothetical protein WB797_02345 [Nocardioides sp.]